MMLLAQLKERSNVPAVTHMGDYVMREPALQLLASESSIEPISLKERVESFRVVVHRAEFAT